MITEDTKQRVITAILNYLSTVSSAPRKTVIDGALAQYGFSPKEILKKGGPATKVNLVRSYIGNELAELIANKSIELSPQKEYCLAKEKLVVVEESQCRAKIMQLLQSKPLTKSQLYSALQKSFGTDKTTSKQDDNAVKQLAGTILREELSKGNLILENENYSLPIAKVKKAYPNEPVSEEVFETMLLERLCDLGGTFFENFVANMMEKYYLITGRDVLLCEVTGGSTDGGVDVVMDTIEELGFVEHIMIQAKCRKNIQVTEKEIREFYGAMNAQRGSRGIFITTSTFHPCAEKLLLSIDNCVGIDGKKIFELVKATAYGIHKTKNGYTFDNTIFS